MSYFQKYLKYKQKYLELSKLFNLNGGGGHALKNTKTVRKNLADYEQIKKEIIKSIEEYNKKLEIENKNVKIIIDISPELQNKEDFGDLDVLYYVNGNFDIKNAIKEIANDPEIVSNGDVISFSYSLGKAKPHDFQIDFIKTTESTIEFTKFYNSYGGLGLIMGTVISSYGLTFGSNGLWIKMDNNRYNFMLTEDPKLFCKFLNMNFEQYKNIKTNDDFYNFIISCRLFKPRMFITFGSKIAKVLENRSVMSLFIDFLHKNRLIEYNSESLKELIEKNKNSKDEKEKEKEEDRLVSSYEKNRELEYTLNFFNKKIEYEQKKEEFEIKNLNNAIMSEKNKIIVKLIREKGYKDKDIGEKKKILQNNINNYDDWLLSASESDIASKVNDILLL